MELIKRYKLDCQLQKQIDYLDKVRNVITSSTLQVSALTAEMKVVITFFGWKIRKMQQCTSDDTVSCVLHIVALTPPNTTVAKSDVWI